MRVSDFSFDLPDELIARYPAEKRSQSRLLVVDGNSGEIQHKVFNQMIDLVTDKDLIIFNNTKVQSITQTGRHTRWLQAYF